MVAIHFGERMSRWFFVVLIAIIQAGGAYAAADSLPKREQLEEIVVTGSRLRTPGNEVSGPVTIFDANKIEALGVSSLPDLFRYLPQAPYTFGENFQFGGAQVVELRGLGVDSTLVLINGRRTVPSAVNLAVNAFDLNVLPLAAVERVEVLSDSASAVYGADAVGGVVNVVLKREIPRPVLEVNVGTAEGGGRERRASLSGGYAGERLHASLMVDYFEREMLLGAERGRWASQDYRRFGSTDRRSANTNPANITSRTTANLPGLPSRSAVVPDGSSGVGLTPTDFLPTAGERALQSGSAYRSIVSDAERHSAALFAEFDALPQLTAFVEALYVDRVTTSQSDPASLSGVRVPANNPYNPFGVDVSVNYLFTGIGPRQAVAQSELQRAVVGLRGVLGDWDWEVAGLHSKETASSWNENVVDITRVNASLASTDPANALNVFQDGPGGSDALLTSLLMRPIARLESGGDQMSAFVRGPLLTLPAGDLQVVLGAEYRTEDIFFDGAVFVDHGRTAKAAFAEARVPLVNPEFGWSLLHEVSLTLAGRQDRYSDFGESFNPQYGLRWMPYADLSLYASYGTSFRAPALFELYSPRRETIGASVSDPRRNGESTPVTLISGGNPDLESVEGESWTAGFSFTPRVLADWRFSGSYWNIVLDGRVDIFTQQLVIANERLFPDRIVRQAPSPADVAAGRPGPVTAIDISRVNFGRVKTDGVDAAVTYATDTAWGRLSLDLSATWVNAFAAVQVPNTPAIERVGVANLDGSIARWRGATTLGWSRLGWGLAATARYIDAYEDRTVAGVDVGREIASQILVDAQASLDLGVALGPNSWVDGFKLTLGVLNVLDEEPPFAEINASIGYDQSQGDLRQRFGYLRMAYQF